MSLKMKKINEDDFLMKNIIKKINDFLIKNSFKENIKTEKKIKLRDSSALIFEKYFIIKKYNKIIETIKKEK